MKTIFFLLSLFCAGASVAQTYRMEIDVINKKLLSGEIAGPEAVVQKRQFDDLTNIGETYPKLPYDTATNEFNFTYIVSCPGVSQKVIYNRIKQWCAIRYADVFMASRYEDLESGKIITKGYSPIVYIRRYEGLFGWKHSETQTNKSYHTLIFTTVEGKVKVEVQDLRYVFSFYQYAQTTGNYTAQAYNEVYFRSLFPVVENTLKEWDGILELVRQTSAVYKHHIDDLARYINDWQKDYKF